MSATALVLLVSGIAEAATTRAPHGAAARTALLIDLDTSLGAALEGERLGEARTLADSIVTLETRILAAKPLAQASAIDSLALRFFAVGNHEGWELAIHYFERSLALKQGALGPDHLEVARTLSAIAALNEYLGKWEEAATYARRALDIRMRQHGPRDPLVASSLRQLGMDRFELGDLAAAESLLVASITTYESLDGDHRERIVDDLNNLGEIHRVMDQFDRAESDFRHGLEVARNGLPEGAPLRVALMNNLAGLFKDLARYDHAEPLLIESLRLREAASDPDSMAIATGHLSLAEIQRLQGRLEEAEPHYALALEIARSILGPQHPELAPFVNQAAALYLELGDYARAETLLRESLAATERALGPDHLGVAQGLDDLGRARVARGAYASADSAFVRALAIRQQRLGASHPEVAVTRVHLAQSLSLGGSADVRAALDTLASAIVVLEASATYPEARLEAYGLRSALRERAGDAAGARADLTLALADIDSLRIRRGGGEFSRAALLSQHLDLYHRSVRLHLGAGDPDGAWEAHERGRARILLDQLASSRLDLRSGIPPAELAPLVEQESRARQRLARAQRLLQSAAPDTTSSEVERLERIAALEALRDSAAWEVQRAIEQIHERNPLWRGLLAGSETALSRADLSRALGRGEVVLEYDIGADASFVFLLENDGKPWRAATLTVGPADAALLGVAPGALDGEKLERIVAGGEGSGHGAGIAPRLGAPPSLAPATSASALDQRLAALGRVLVPASIAARLRRATHAVIVPDGALHLVPFEALVMRLDRGRARYWIDDGPALRYAASAMSLLELERRDAASARAPGAALTVLSVSDPAFAAATGAAEERGGAQVERIGRGVSARQDSTLRGAGPWLPLPGTRLETAAIRAAFAPLPVDTLVGAAATEPAVRAALACHRLLHLATHGFVTERRGDVLGGLVLAHSAADSAGTDDDGLLQLFEIYGMKLDADLVVLSACETARGPRVAGEGVVALSRGFLAAGARRAIASLWPVNDASTAELMRDLFGRLALASRSGRPIDYPLLVRDAKRALRSRPGFETPFYWAPFVLSGVR